MKKAILYFIAALMLASIPAMDLMASRASHGDWYFREEWGGTQYSAYVAGNGKVHYKILVFASGSSRNFWAYSDENDITQGSRCWTQLQGSAAQPVFLIYEADNKGHNKPLADEGRNPNDRGWVKLKVLSDAIIVTNTYDGVPVHVAPDGQWHEFYLKRMSTADWLTYSDGVLLTWELTDGNVGYYTIETRPAGTDSAWTLLVDSLYTGWYKDITANPYVSPEWEYRLTMTYECNGNTKSVSDSVVGSRNPYGKVSGYVRYEDGTACPNIEVNAYRTSGPDAPVQTVLTDENGYYMLDSLLYGSGYAYAITPTSQTAQFEYNHTSSGTATITLDLDDCIAENINFINISSVLLSGRVLYENTTIPARDVNFLLNGIMVKNGTTPYKTDASGNFEFRVPKNSAFTVQAVRDGHWFARDGYIFTLNRVTQQEDSLLTLSEGLPGVRIWDQTKVRLIGRLAGGRIQAEKTLGFGLSQNNLGDDLQMVFELEGDNISHIVSIAQDKTIDHIDTVVRHDVRNGGVLDSVGVTAVEYQKKRIIIHPDATTGEYEVDLFPVKYKITQATARGYAALFSEGKTSETLDLTNAPLHQFTNTEGGKEVDYNETYSITYHSPIAITCTQMRYGMEVGYYGVAEYKADYGLYWLYISPAADANANVQLRFYSPELKRIFDATSTFPFRNDTQLGSITEPYTPEWAVNTQK